MDSLLGINPNASLVNSLTNKTVSPAYALLASELSLSIPGLFNYSATYAGISAKGQLLSATVTFQDKLQALRPAVADGSADFAELAANTQSLVNAFNTLQRGIADINSLNNLPASGVAGAMDLARTLDMQTLATYANADSALTRLSQLGIRLQPSLLPGGGSTLSLDLGALEAAYASDAKGASALLAKVAGTFSDTAASFIGRSGSQYPSLDALMQTSPGNPLLSNLSQAQTGNSLYSLLANLPQGGGTNWRQAYAVISEYSMVSGLLG
jgi:hypothetical protein